MASESWLPEKSRRLYLTSVGSLGDLHYMDEQGFFFLHHARMPQNTNKIGFHSIAVSFAINNQPFCPKDDLKCIFFGHLIWQKSFAFTGHKRAGSSSRWRSQSGLGTGLKSEIRRHYLETGPDPFALVIRVELFIHKPCVHRSHL